jgi:hypothetical protein
VQRRVSMILFLPPWPASGAGEFFQPAQVGGRDAHASRRWRCSAPISRSPGSSTGRAGSAGGVAWRMAAKSAMRARSASAMPSWWRQSR